MMKISTKGEYYGKLNTETSFNGIMLSEYDYTGDRTPWHYHENPYFMYVLKGNMIDGNSQIKTLCPPGSIMYNNWQESHYGAKHSQTAGGFHLEFEKKWFVENGVSLDILEGSQLIEDPQIHFLFAKLYREFLLSDVLSEVSVELLLLQICDHLNSTTYSKVKNPPDWIFKLKEILHYDSSQLSLKYLAHQLGVHPVHISRYAPKYLSVSLGEYLRQLKLKKALPLLMDSKRPLTQVACEAGFSDQSHFNRVFKSYFDTNPSSYRKPLKNRSC